MAKRGSLDEFETRKLALLNKKYFHEAVKAEPESDKFQMSSKDQDSIKQMQGNKYCADCGQKGPGWASVSFGSLICLVCAGIHRGLGVHISYVRSLPLDSWSKAQVATMHAGGNQKMAKAFRAAGMPERLLSAKGEMTIEEKYSSNVAAAYKDALNAETSGKRAIPLPRWKTDPLHRNRTTLKTSAQMEEEARARMQAKFGKVRPGESFNERRKGNGKSSDEWCILL